jgi:uncharacterized protein (DUF2252 family)
VNAYRAHIAEYAELNPLEVWYSSIPIESVLENSKSEDVKKRVAKKIEKARNRTLTGEDYPKLTEPVNGRVRIKDNPPLIYHRVDVNSAEYHHLVQEAFTRYCDTLGEEKRIMIDQYKIVDIAAKVVGIGSVGTLCSIILMMTYDNEVLFLQVKEARTSVMEPFAGRSLYKNNGQRVVSGQKLMQAATDVFLGWTELPNGKHYFIRQLRDMKIKPSVELYDAEVMSDYAALCGWTLARAHARSGKAAVISGYLGSSEKFDDAIAEFGVQYAEQNERDYNALMNAVRSGKLEAYFER